MKHILIIHFKSNVWVYCVKDLIKTRNTSHHNKMGKYFLCWWQLYTGLLSLNKHLYRHIVTLCMIPQPLCCVLLPPLSVLWLDILSVAGGRRLSAFGCQNGCVGLALVNQTGPGEWNLTQNNNNNMSPSVTLMCL